MKRIATTAFALMVLMSGPVLAAGLSASVNAPQVALGDTFQLTLSASGQGAAAPDLSPLYDDFDVLGTSQSSSTQIINGRRSQSQSWIVTLSAKSTGRLTIPAISAGALSSDASAITVLDASQMPKLQGASGISVNATIEGDAHYRFQEIPLTVRIESAVGLQNAQLIAPTGDFELTQTGQDRSSQITRNGAPVAVTERHYLLRPQSEGALTIPPFTLRGAVADPNARRDPFGRGVGGRDPFAMMDQMMAQMGGGMMRSPFSSMFAPQGKPFVARSDALTLDIKASPGGASDWFLPAKAVELQAAWTPDNPTFREGEAVTRRISILALGARPEQLPNLTFADAPGARIYLDDTTSDLAETEKGTVARKDFLLSVVPTQGGQVTLPEVSVSWLDTATGETKTATLPATTLEVDGVAPTAPAPAAATSSIAPTPAVEPAVDWRSIGLGGVGGVFLALMAWWALRQMPPASRPTPLRDLKRAARRGDRAGVYAALLKLRVGHPNAALHEAQRVLEGDVYAGSPQKTPDLTKLARSIIRAIRQDNRTMRSRAAQPGLGALYPE